MSGDVFFRTARRRIHAFLQTTLIRRRDLFRLVPSVGDDARARLTRFLTSGKAVRGGLVLLGAQLAGQRPRHSHLQVAAAAELLHAALLIHDDIMDRDDLRRGRPTLFAQYARWARTRRIADPLHYGQSQAISLGDVAFFLGFELLGTAPVSATVGRTLVGTTARELVAVGLAQMEDVRDSHVWRSKTSADILSLYRHKTARYTFSLPLLLGATLANARPALRRSLSALGETLGIMFQIRDDTLGLYGTEKQLGKPVGSDIRERKQTLYASLLFRRARGSDLRRIERLFGSATVTNGEVRLVRSLVERLGIRNDVERIMQRLAQQARRQIRKLPASGSREILLDLVDYSLTREG